MLLGLCYTGGGGQGFTTFSHPHKSSKVKSCEIPPPPYNTRLLASFFFFVVVQKKCRGKGKGKREHDSIERVWCRKYGSVSQAFC